jgi:hypothetical protein
MNFLLKNLLHKETPEGSFCLQAMERGDGNKKMEEKVEIKCALKNCTKDALNYHKKKRIKLSGKQGAANTHETKLCLEEKGKKET